MITKMPFPTVFSFTWAPGWQDILGISLMRIGLRRLMIGPGKLVWSARNTRSSMVLISRNVTFPVSISGLIMLVSISLVLLTCITLYAYSSLALWLVY